MGMAQFLVSRPFRKSALNIYRLSGRSWQLALNE